jgi:hypothetical protein
MYIEAFVCVRAGNSILISVNTSTFLIDYSVTQAGDDAAKVMNHRVKGNETKRKRLNIPRQIRINIQLPFNRRQFRKHKLIPGLDDLEERDYQARGVHHAQRLGVRALDDDQSANPLEIRH